jgi:hypothetical protein
MDVTRDNLLHGKKSGLKNMLEEEGFGLTIPFEGEKWRSISGNLIREIGCVIGIDKNTKEMQQILLMPIMVRKKPIALIKAKMVKDKGFWRWNRSYYLLCSFKWSNVKWSTTCKFILWFPCPNCYPCLTNVYKEKRII